MLTVKTSITLVIALLGIASSAQETKIQPKYIPDFNVEGISFTGT
jgi:hypothetical protein